MTVQIWVHQFNDKTTARGEQSRMARQLVDVACCSNGMSLSREILEMPGLELIESVASKYHLALSISHSRQLLVVALAEGHLGVDCETPGRSRNWRGIADNFFSAGEARTVRNATQCESERIFLQHWVLKESFIKANRGSIFGDLNRLVVSNGLTEATLDNRPLNEQPWWLWQGYFGNNLLGMSGAMSARPELSFFECPELARGEYQPCDKRVTGTFLRVIAEP